MVVEVKLDASNSTASSGRRNSTTSNQESPIPGSRLPMGTLFALDTIREYRVAVKRRSDEDPHGQQSFNGHIASR